mmetsp:Transcript_104517/g.305125  ORF Transcript_104517/g.305125 Transcript_104517/m.305125 type:complete len:367 (+) Transcript_104517:21-1121(+)
MRLTRSRGLGAVRSVAMIVACRQLSLCSGATSDCPADMRGVGGQSLLQRVTHHAVHPSTPSDSLYIVVVTGIPSKDVAARMQKSMVPRLRPQDRYVHICETGCLAMANGSLQNVVEMDSSVFPGGRCLEGGKVCSSYRDAQMKFVYGLVHLVQKHKKDGASMPGWWLVKDDDTYVHVPNLMKSITGHQPTDLVSFADTTCRGICGGAGWLLSNALAEKLALHYSDRWMRLMNKMILMPKWTMMQCYDMHIPRVLRWVPGARLFWHPGMQFQSPFDDQCTNSTFEGLYWDPSEREIQSRNDRKRCERHGAAWKAVVRPLPELTEDIGSCYSSSTCLCSFSRLPCTWHLQASKGMGRFEAAMELLDLE